MSNYIPWTTNGSPNCDSHLDVYDDNEQLVATDVSHVNAERIVACVNACAGIETEALCLIPWRLAPVQGAHPNDVAKMILKLRKYEDALNYIVSQLEHEQDWQAALTEANQALQP